MKTLITFCFCVSFHFISGFDGDPFPARKVKEVHITGGKAGASSFYSDAWRPENGFDPDGPMWHAGPSSKPNDFPVLVWYEFKQAFLPAEVSFRPRQDCCIQQTPTRYQVVGTNDAICDDDAAWTILCEDMSDKAFRGKFDTRICKVKEEVTEKFKCVGLRIFGNLDHKSGWCSLNNIRMWERI